MRRGISLLEVLIAIGVMAIGLLALLTLLPLGHYKYAQSVRYDRASTLASNAMVDVQIRGNALNPLFWLDANGNSALNPADNGQTFNPALTPPLQPPFILDPLAISHPGNTAAPPGYFPVSTAGLPGPPPTIHRLTLRDSDAGPPMPHPLAELMFVADDDVVFSIPENPDIRTTLAGWTVGADGDWGVAGTDDNGDGVVDDPGEAGWPGSDDGSPRNAAGDYSYLVMVLPLGGQAVVDTVQFQVSVVVFQKRPITGLSPASPYSEPPPERMLLGDAVGNGIGGGDFTLRTQAGTSQADAMHLLKIRPEEWLLLSAWKDDPAEPSGQRPVCQWYRVAGVDEGPRLEASGEYVRDVILDGPDWNPLAHRDADGAGVPTAYATLLVGCCKVVEQEVTLDD